MTRASKCQNSASNQSMTATPLFFFPNKLSSNNSIVQETIQSELVEESLNESEIIKC
jgi:hypothetical protein